MKRVILESPYAGDVFKNVLYARMCIKDSLSRGEAPIASHLLYTQPKVLDDNNPDERQWGIDAGLSWKSVSELQVFYTDLGWSKGMEYGKQYAEEHNIQFEERKLGPEVMIDFQAKLINICLSRNTQFDELWTLGV